jgi:hypothetical protein
MPRTAVPANPFYDAAVVDRADRAIDRALDDLLSRAPGPREIHVPAPAGAGKSWLIVQGVGQARDCGLRVAVAAPTNKQAFGLVSTTAQLHGARQAVTFVPARDVVLPETIQRLPGVQVCEAVEAGGQDLIIGTLDKLGDAFARGYLQPFDVLLIDESYQADAATYYAVGGLAPLHLLVGDSGQISPFSTIDDPCRWRGLPEDPLQTAVGVLRRNHPGTPVHWLPITRRLDGRAVPVARLFYPDLAFTPAVRPGVRALRLSRGAGPDGRGGALDRCLDLATGAGWAHAELPRAAILSADPATVALLADLVARLFARAPQVRCERQTTAVELRPEQVAVGVPHNDQKDLLRVALAGRGLGQVVVETANKLQGLEFEVVLVWHPLAGLPEPDGFHLDPGRLCVLLTRHRQACIVVGRAGDADLVTDQVPPTTAAYLGWDPDPVLDGWDVQRNTFTALEPYRIPM